MVLAAAGVGICLVMLLLAIPPLLFGSIVAALPLLVLGVVGLIFFARFGLRHGRAARHREDEDVW